MSTLEPPAESGAQTVSRALADEELAKLRREADLGDLHFGDVIEKLVQIRQIVQAYLAEDQRELPPNLVANLESQVNVIPPLLEQMRAASLREGYDAMSRETIESQVESVRVWLLENVRPQLRGQVVRSSADLTALAQAVERANRNSAEIDQVLDKARRAAGEVGTGRVSSFHESQSKRYAKQARNALVGISVAGVVLAGLGLWFFVEQPPSTDTKEWPEIAHDLIVRFFFLGLAAYALAFFARNYRVARHLQVTHEQRRVSLDTYPLLIEALVSDDELAGDTRNIITAEMARGTFGPVESGFLNEDRERTVIESQSSMVPALTALRR